MKLKRLTILAMLIAMYCVLAILTPIKLLSFKFTFEAFPILVASLLLGPWYGLIVGGVGSFIYQILFSGYGFTATTLLWIIPHAFSGLLVGFYAQNKVFNLTKKQIIFITICSALCVTLLNTFVLYVDAKIYCYYTKTIVFGSLLLKIITGIILAIIYSCIMPKLINLLKQK